MQNKEIVVHLDADLKKQETVMPPDADLEKQDTVMQVLTPTERLGI